MQTFSSVLWHRLNDEPDPTTPEELGALLQAEIQKWTDLVRVPGLRLQ